jgi:hypothetical protein
MFAKICTNMCSVRRGRFNGPMLTDSAFSQSAVTVLGASTLALMLQARLVATPAAHPIPRRARRFLAAFDVYLTTTLWILAVGTGYILFRHLATNTGALSDANRRWVEWLLLPQLVGLGVISLINRVVPVVWKAPEARYLQPRLDDDMLGKLILALITALSAAAPLLLLTGHPGAQILLFVALGALAHGLYQLGHLVAPPIDRRAARYWDRQARLHGYQTVSVAVELPGGFSPIIVDALRRASAVGVEFLGYDAARRIVRHHNGARRFRFAESPMARVPQPLRLKLSLRNFGWIVVAGDRTGRLPWVSMRPAHAPRGFVRWDGPGVPLLQTGSVPSLDGSEGQRRPESQTTETHD